MREYKYMTLADVLRYEPEMKRLGVSKIARGRSGFLTQYKRVGGNPDNLSEAWKRKRHGFIRRHLAQYTRNKTPRRRLALIAWAYMPR